ncbi:MAG: hypothetical protein HRT72_09665 [Flavobacteriales bacterium]|nr:hypothetical protein [Flavobacteriales bacterium]
MIIKYSDNLFLQIAGVIYHNGGRIIAFIILSSIAVLQKEVCLIMGWEVFELPVIPVSILGSALAIFLAFRNNHAYDRWWEARKMWGGIVNTSRSLSMMILSFGSTVYGKGDVTDEQVKEWQREIVHRHIAWIYSLVHRLRDIRNCELYGHYLSEDDISQIKPASNRPARLLLIQGKSLQKAYEDGIIEDFRHMELVTLIKELYSLQGQTERIKNTVFPYYYNYFTRVFMWFFIIAFPYVLVPSVSWWIAILVSVAINFVFSILEKSGTITEEPFEDRAADTPMSSITRNIEIDLLEMLGDDNIPEPWPADMGKFNVEYIK